MKLRLVVICALCIAGILMAQTAARAAAGTARLSGRVLDASNRSPVHRATVSIIGPNKEVDVDENGEFSFTELDAGSYSVRITALGYKPRVERVTLSGAEAKKLEFTLSAQPTINEVMVVTASGQVEPLRDATQSIGVIDNEELKIAKTVGLNEVLNEIPGVKAESQSETQEVRISIRGRGVRTGFGIRGVRLLIDGIPESDSSGETQDLTGFDLASLDRIEVIKGPSSALYGATSAGVVNMVTEQGSAVPQVELGSLMGSYGFLKNQVKVSGTYRPMQYLFNVSRTELDGYREHSHLLAYHFTSRLDFHLGDKTGLSFFTRYSDSDSQLPGNLSATDVATDRRQAAFLFKLFDAQSNENRFLMGTTFNHQWGADKNLSVTFFGRAFDFQVPVPFLYINGDRTSFGGNVKFTFKQPIFHKDNFFSLGLEAQHHNQYRKDFDNVAGNPGDSVQRNENRYLSDVGFYWMDLIKLTENLDLRAGISYARINNRVKDLFLVDGDDTGERVFDRVTYQVGGAYHFSPSFTLYSNIVTGFEPPTDSEIGRNPSGTGGLNPNIKPERSINYEVGGLIDIRRRASINFAAFHMRVDDEIVPTGIGFPQELFGNAAKATHNGFELGAGLNISRDLDFRAAYTFSDFYFKEFINGFGDFSGNDLPGIPAHHLNMSLKYRNPLGFYAGMNVDVVGKFFADDANQVANDQYSVANLFVGYNRFFKKYKLTLQYRLNNAFSEKYNEFIVINDRFGGYFYPAPTRNHTGTVSISRFF